MTIAGYPAEMRAVAGRYGLTEEQLRGKHRHQPLVEARWVLMGLLRRKGASLPAIGRVLHRDHTTVLYGLTILRVRPDLQAEVDRLELDSPQPDHRQKPAEQANHKSTAPTTTDPVVVDVAVGDRSVRVEVR